MWWHFLEEAIESVKYCLQFIISESWRFTANSSNSHSLALSGRIKNVSACEYLLCSFVYVALSFWLPTISKTVSQTIPVRLLVERIKICHHKLCFNGQMERQKGIRARRLRGSHHKHWLAGGRWEDAARSCFFRSAEFPLEAKGQLWSALRGSEWGVQFSEELPLRNESRKQRS